MATDVDAADHWWFSEPPARRVQIHKFLSRGGHLDHPHVDGQLEIPMPRTKKSKEVTPHDRNSRRHQ